MREKKKEGTLRETKKEVRILVKNLTKLGNSWALVLDTVLRELIGIDVQKSPSVNIEVRGKELVITALRKDQIVNKVVNKGA